MQISKNGRVCLKLCLCGVSLPSAADVCPSWICSLDVDLAKSQHHYDIHSHWLWLCHSDCDSVDFAAVQNCNVGRHVSAFIHNLNVLCVLRFKVKRKGAGVERALSEQLVTSSISASTGATASTLGVLAIPPVHVTQRRSPTAVGRQVTQL